MTDYAPRSFPEGMSRADLEKDNARLRDLVAKLQSGGTTRLGNDANPIGAIHDRD